MTIETIAEVLCNLAGEDPNDETAWRSALDEAAHAEVTDAGIFVR